MGMNDNYKQPLFGSFQRLRDFALDPSTIHQSVSELEEYINSSGIAYTGQFVFVKETESIYVIDLDNFHRDETGELRHFIRFAGLGDIEELRESIKEMVSDLEGELDTKGDAFNQNLEEATAAIKAQVEGIKQEVHAEVNNKLGTFYTKTEADELHEQINKKIKDEIAKILGTEEGIEDEINTLIEIVEYINQHGLDFADQRKRLETLEGASINTNSRIDDVVGQIQQLESSIDKDITDKVNTLNTKVDENISRLDEKIDQKVTADQVKELIGGAKLKNVEQTMILPSFNDVGIFDEGTIFKSITVEFDKAKANESDIFRIKYLDRTGTAYPLIDTQDIDIVDSSQCSYEYILNIRPNYEEVNGQYKVLIETNANPEKLHGKVYITYFLENN